jgi:hypothetical protein
MDTAQHLYCHWNYKEAEYWDPIVKFNPTQCVACQKSVPGHIVFLYSMIWCDEIIDHRYLNIIFIAKIKCR